MLKRCSILSVLAASALFLLTPDQANAQLFRWGWGGQPYYYGSYYPSYYGSYSYYPSSYWGSSYYSPWYSSYPSYSNYSYPSFSYRYPTYSSTPTYTYSPPNYYGGSFYSYPTDMNAVGGASFNYQSSYPAMQAGQDENRVRLNIQTPADAELRIENQAMSGSGAFRQFVSPPLTEGKTYTYDVEARWQRDGRWITEKRTATFTAGRVNELTFDLTRPLGSTSAYPSTTVPAPAANPQATTAPPAATPVPAGNNPPAISTPGGQPGGRVTNPSGTQGQGTLPPQR